MGHRQLHHQHHHRGGARRSPRLSRDGFRNASSMRARRQETPASPVKSGRCAAAPASLGGATRVSVAAASAAAAAAAASAASVAAAAASAATAAAAAAAAAAAGDMNVSAAIQAAARASTRWTIWATTAVSTASETGHCIATPVTAGCDDVDRHGGVGGSARRRRSAVVYVKTTRACRELFRARLRRESAIGTADLFRSLIRFRIKISQSRTSCDRAQRQGNLTRKSAVDLLRRTVYLQTYHILSKTATNENIWSSDSKVGCEFGNKTCE